MGKKFETLYTIFTILVLFLYSKTEYFGIVMRSSFQFIAFSVTVLGLLILGCNKKQLKNNMVAFLPLFIAVFLNILVYWRVMNGTQRNESIGVYVSFLVPIFASCFIKKEFFCTWYMRIVAVFCIISLVCYILMIRYPSLPYALCMPNSFKVGQIYSPYFTWSQGLQINTPIRNCGPFWEPGAWADFLCLAILMLLRDSDAKEIRHRASYLILFFATLLTTRSAAGYIVAGLIMALQYKALKTTLSGIKPWARSIMAISIAIFVVYFVVTSGIIQQKFTDDNVSYSTRSGDFVGGMQMIVKEGGILGLGCTNNRSVQRSIYGISKNDSVGFWSLAYTYGILAFISYVCIYVSRMKKFFNVKTKVDFFAILLIITILHMTEGLWFLAVFIMILCYDSSDLKVNEAFPKEEPTKRIS